MLVGGLIGGTFGAVFAAFYALASWLLNTGRTNTPSSWLPYLYTALVVWLVIALTITGGVVAVAFMYRLTKVNYGGDTAGPTV